METARDTTAAGVCWAPTTYGGDAIVRLVRVVCSAAIDAAGHHYLPLELSGPAHPYRRVVWDIVLSNKHNTVAYVHRRSRVSTPENIVQRSPQR